MKAYVSHLATNHIGYITSPYTIYITFDNHVNWIRFLKDNWERAMKEKYPILKNYKCCGDVRFPR